MGKEKTIEHEGVVKQVLRDVVVVEILSKSACSGCSARSLCTSSESKVKEVNAVPTAGVEYEVGESVKVVGSESMGRMAVVLCFVVPLLLMVVVLVVLSGREVGDGWAGLLSLGVLLPYYLVLYAFRGRFEKSKTFVFTIEKLETKNSIN